MKGSIDWNKVMEELNQLIDEGYGLIGLIGDYDDHMMRRYLDRLHRFRYYQLFSYLDFRHLVISMESEKDRFEVQKIAQYHDKCLRDEVESFITISRQWEADDYRCRRYQERMEKIFLKLKAIVNEE